SRVGFLAVVAVAAVASACASAQRQGEPVGERAVYQDVSIEEVRRAALAVVDERAGEARVDEDGHVVAERGHAGHWTTFEVRLDRRGAAVAAEAEVVIDHDSCRRSRSAIASPTRRGHLGAYPVALEGGRVELVPRSIAVGHPTVVCEPRGNRSPGVERGLLEEIERTLAE
ncbi:MAG: hypothetical protein R3326_08795, partial [Gemmatimonadota bacterium]|nr:hypothetical protein [Gemmatimonadota bacterium]